VGTLEFSKAIIQNLGKKPETLKSVVYQDAKAPLIHKFTPSAPIRKLMGIDIYIYHRGSLEQFLSKISHINVGALHLTMISNRGVRVWPQGQPETSCIEQWRCRFLADHNTAVSQNDVIQIQHAFDHMEMDVIKAEYLYTFDDKPGYSSAEG
jgi:isocitrate dehydrogenase